MQDWRFLAGIGVALLCIVVFALSRRCRRRLEAILTALVILACLPLTDQACQNKLLAESRRSTHHYRHLRLSDLAGLSVHSDHFAPYQDWARQARPEGLPGIEDVHAQPFRAFRACHLDIATASSHALASIGGCRACAERIVEYRSTGGDLAVAIPFFNRQQSNFLRIRDAKNAVAALRVGLLSLTWNVFAVLLVLNVGRSRSSAPWLQLALPVMIGQAWIGILLSFSASNLCQDTRLLYDSMLSSAGLGLLVLVASAALQVRLNHCLVNFPAATSGALFLGSCAALLVCVGVVVARPSERLAFYGVTTMFLCLPVFIAGYFSRWKSDHDLQLTLRNDGAARSVVILGAIGGVLAILATALRGPSAGGSLGDLGSAVVMGAGLLLFIAWVCGAERWGARILCASTLCAVLLLTLAAVLNVSVARERVALWVAPFRSCADFPNGQTVLDLRAWLALSAAGGCGLGSREVSIPDALADFPLTLLAGYTGTGLPVAVCLGYALLTHLLLYGSRRSTLPFHSYLCAFAACSLGAGWILMGLSNVFCLPATGFPIPPLSWARAHALVYDALLGATLFAVPGPETSARLADKRSPLVPTAALALGWVAVLACLWWAGQPDQLSALVRPGHSTRGAVLNQLWSERYRQAPPILLDRTGALLARGDRIEADEITTLLDDFLCGPAPHPLEDPDLWAEPGFDWRKHLDAEQLDRLVHPLRYSNDDGRTVLTLDRDLTRFAAALLEERGDRGLIVVLGNLTGDILCAVAQPALDPEQAREVRHRAEAFEAGRLRGQERERALEEAEMGALLDATEILFHPASTFKAPVCLAASRQGLGDLNFPCRGNRCWTAHGQVDMTQALAWSCNEWHRQVVARLGAERLLAEAGRLGLHDPGGIDPTAVDSFARELPSVAIGQGSLLVSAPRLAAVYAGLWTGTVMVPRLILKTTTNGGPAATEPKAQAKLRDEDVQRVREGLMAVVQTGTARAAFRDFTGPVIGKTGTTEEPYGPTSALFIGATPEHTVLVWLHHGGSGAYDAAPIARRMLDRVR